MHNFFKNLNPVLYDIESESEGSASIKRIIFTISFQTRTITNDSRILQTLCFCLSYGDNVTYQKRHINTCKRIVRTLKLVRCGRIEWLTRFESFTFGIVCASLYLDNECVIICDYFYSIINNKITHNLQPNSAQL